MGQGQMRDIETSGILDKKCQRRKGARVKLGIREGTRGREQGKGQGEGKWRGRKEFV